MSTARSHSRAMSTALVLSDSGKRRDGRWVRGSLVGTSESGSTQWAQRMAEAGAIIDRARAARARAARRGDAR